MEFVDLKGELTMGGEQSPSTPALNFSPDGTVTWRGEVIAKDEEIYTVLQAQLAATLGPQAVCESVTFPGHHPDWVNGELAVRGLPSDPKTIIDYRLLYEIASREVHAAREWYAREFPGYEGADVVYPWDHQ